MKVSFLYADFSLGGRGKFSHGVAFLSSYLKRYGYTTSLLHLTEKIEKNQYISWLDNEKPDLLAFSATTHVYPYIRKLALWTKEWRDIPLIVGGIHATLLPEEVISQGPFDFLCVGEGEDPLLELCQRLKGGGNISNIKNIWVRRGESFIKNPLRPPIQELDTLPFPDREFMDYGNSFDLIKMRRGIFLASRGCPFDCTYCCNHALRKLYKNTCASLVRFRGVDNVLNEIEEVLSKYQEIEHIAFHDDILPLNKRWFEEFTRAYKKRVGLPFQMNARVELMSRDIFKMAREGGLYLLSMGVESGSEDIRFNLLKRKIANKKMVEVFSLARELGIKTYSYNMVGFPGESFRDMLNTAKLNARIHCDKVQVSILYPYPRTEIFEHCKKKGLLTNRRLENYCQDTILKFSSIRRRQMRFVYSNFKALIKGYKILLTIFPRYVSIPNALAYIFLYLLTFTRMDRAFKVTVKCLTAPVRKIRDYAH